MICITLIMFASILNKLPCFPSTRGQRTHCQEISLGLVLVHCMFHVVQLMQQRKKMAHRGRFAVLVFHRLFLNQASRRHEAVIDSTMSHIETAMTRTQKRKRPYGNDATDTDVLVTSIPRELCLILPEDA